MKRLPIILATLLSLVCITILFLWIRSYCIGYQSYKSEWRAQRLPSDPITLHLHESARWLILARGTVAIETRTQDVPSLVSDAFPPAAESSQQSSYDPPSPVVPSHAQGSVQSALGFGYWENVYNGVCTNRRWWFPLWAPTLLTAIYPALHFTRRLRRRKHSLANQCPDCGYDLRATKERCPECGRPI